MRGKLYSGSIVICSLNFFCYHITACRYKHILSPCHLRSYGEVGGVEKS